MSEYGDNTLCIEQKIFHEKWGHLEFWGVKVNLFTLQPEVKSWIMQGEFDRARHSN